MLLPAVFFTPLMDEGAGSASVNILFCAGLAAAGLGLAAIVLGAVKKVKGNLIGGCFLTIAGALLALVAKTSMYQDNAVFTAPGLNSIACWPSP